MLLLDGAFTALLLLVGSVSAVIVLPPTNVNVSCQNLRVMVSWEYSQRQPQTSFWVNITGAAGRSAYETTAHQYDLTHFIWASEKRYMDNFYVTVAAIRGSNQSEPAESKTFTFNDVKTTDIKYKLDFPPVNLNAKDSGATVGFRNPFHFYTELKQASKPDTAKFAFKVITDRGDEDFVCTVKEENCKRDIVLPEGEECVRLKGWLLDGIGVGQVLFRETRRICITQSTEVHVMTLVVLLSVTALIISVVVIIICKAKAWTMKTTESLPTPLWLKRGDQERKYITVSNTDISAVRLTVNPCNEPSVTTKVEVSPSKDEVSSTESLQDSSAGLYVEGGLPEGSDEELGAAALISEGHRTDDDSADDSVKTECVSMDSEEVEEAASGYDRPHVLRVDMGDGDMVTAYIGR